MKQKLRPLLLPSREIKKTAIGFTWSLQIEVILDFQNRGVETNYYDKDSDRLIMTYTT